MSKLPTTPNNLKQPSPDNNGLGKHKQQSTDVDTQAAQVNRNTDKLEESDKLEKPDQLDRPDKLEPEPSDKATANKSKSTSRWPGKR